MRFSLSAAALALCLAAFGSGCGLVGVEMTSSPESVRFGDPVTFDIKLTNHSQCPVNVSIVELLAFIPAEDFISVDNLDGELGPNPPPEVLAFIAALSAFFDELCAGGTPTLPDPPMFPTMACTRGDDELICTATGPAPGHEGESGSMTFATFGDRLRCEIDAGSMSCRLRLRLPSGSASAASGAAAQAIQSLQCITGADFGELDSNVALCAVGSVENPEDLAGAGMATGQVILPARGSGVVRNLVVVGAEDAEDAGVCKGGADAGDACELGASDCPASTCGEGICDGGANDGLGCDVSTVVADCGAGITCTLCNGPNGLAFLPIDCTTTRIAPEAAPATSPWGLAGLAVMLFGAGVFWLQRQARRSA